VKTFFITLISIYTVMHVYVLWRIATIPFLNRNVTRGWFILAGICLWSLVFLARFFNRQSTGGTALMVLDFIGMYWLALLFLIFVSFVVVELITGFGFLLPRLSPQLRVVALAAAGTLSAIALVQGFRAPVVESYDVVLSDLPAEMDGSVIVAISDLHVGGLRGKSWLEARVAQVQSARPDLIVLLGDYFESTDKPESAAEYYRKALETEAPSAAEREAVRSRY